MKTKTYLLAAALLFSSASLFARSGDSVLGNGHFLPDSFSFLSSVLVQTQGNEVAVAFLADYGTVEVYVSDMLGNCVEAQSVDTSAQNYVSFNVANLPQGDYLVEVVNENGEIVNQQQITVK